MKISYKCDYALKIVLDLALMYRPGFRQLTQARDIAMRQDIPEKFLIQIINVLKKSNYIDTQRGPHGGICLAKEPAQIKLGEIVRLIEGTTSPIGCVSCAQFNKCDFEEKCAFFDIWKDLRIKINDVVDNTTFEDVCHKHRAKQGAYQLEYYI